MTRTTLRRWYLAVVAAAVAAAVLTGCPQQDPPQPDPAPTTAVVADSTVTTVAPTTTAAPTSTSTATSATPAGTATVRPSGGDDTPALVAAIAANPVVIVDQPLRIDNIVKITTSNRTITFTGTGELRRTTIVNPAKPADTVTFQAILVQGATNVTLNNPVVAGPGGVCDIPRDPPSPGLPPIMQAIFDRRYESQHALSIDGATNVTVNGGYLHDMRGDGIYVVNNSRGTRINNVHTRCTGRSSISVVGGTDTIITGGLFERSALWAFNAEPYGAQRVDGLRIERPKVGVTNWELLFVGGTCNVTGIVLNKPDLTLRGGANSIHGCATPTGAPAYTFTP